MMMIDRIGLEVPFTHNVRKGLSASGIKIKNIVIVGPDPERESCLEERRCRANRSMR